MAVEVKFGNLGIDELERDIGIKLTEADRKFLQETRQEQVMEGKEAVKMPTRAWHFFDIPRVLELGSYSFYLEIESLLPALALYLTTGSVVLSVMLWIVTGGVEVLSRLEVHRDLNKDNVKLVEDFGRLADRK